MADKITKSRSYEWAAELCVHLSSRCQSSHSPGRNESYREFDTVSLSSKRTNCSKVHF